MKLFGFVSMNSAKNCTLPLKITRMIMVMALISISTIVFHNVVLLNRKSEDIIPIGKINEREMNMRVFSVICSKTYKI